MFVYATRSNLFPPVLISFPSLFTFCKLPRSATTFSTFKKPIWETWPGLGRTGPRLHQKHLPCGWRWGCQIHLQGRCLRNVGL